MFGVSSCYDFFVEFFLPVHVRFKSYKAVQVLVVFHAIGSKRLQESKGSTAEGRVGGLACGTLIIFSEIWHVSVDSVRFF